jgi:LPXTG-motif cell wall-anchored protein
LSRKPEVPTPETSDITLQYRSASWRRVLLLPIITLVLIALVTTATPRPAEGADSLSVRPITWDVIGLDSNKVTDGPARYPVGARICNTGGTTTSAVTARFAWDSTNAHLALLGPATVDVGALAPSACSDVYFDIAVARDKAAWNTTRAYHVDVLVGTDTIARTPTDRQLFVEKLVSQNRNDVTKISGGGGLADPAATTVYVGSTYRYVLHGKTATNGYEQLEAFLDFPTTIFRVVGVSATYTAPTGGTSSAVYANACGWDPTATSPTYRSCVGPTTFGGKAGGDIVVTYDVLVTGTGTTSLTGLIYDFSGSSYHYNGDYGTALESIEITAVDPTPVTTTTAPTTTTTTSLPTSTTTVPDTTTTIPTTTIPDTTTTVPATTTTVPATTTTIPTTTIPDTTTTIPDTTIPDTTTTVPDTTTSLPTSTVAATTIPTTTVPTVAGGVPTTTVPGGPPATWVTPVPDEIFGTPETTPDAAPTTVVPTETAEATGTVTGGADGPEANVVPTLPSTGSSAPTTLAVAAILLAGGSLISRVGRRSA